MEEKIKFIDEYITKLQKAIDSQNSEKADRLQDEIIAIFDSEIKNIRESLDNYSYDHITGRTIDFLGDAELLKGKLINNNLVLKDLCQRHQTHRTSILATKCLEVNSIACFPICC